LPEKEATMDANTGLQWDVPVGVSVVDADGADLGKVIESRPGLLVVEKGRIFPSDLYVPRAAIASFDGEHVRLAVAMEEALEYRWDREPGTEPYGGDYVTDPFAPAGAGAVGTGAPGYVEDPEATRMSGTANQAPGQTG
jgi:hypothetical protein